ncbi:hypothetical protein, partial [Neisseria dentiae]|uniref:hypothetical protein n=1 Tax=Neisseria dentiae TaxID=194197 RepID=UPI00359FE6ED
MPANTIKAGWVCQIKTGATLAGSNRHPRHTRAWPEYLFVCYENNKSSGRYLCKIQHHLKNLISVISFASPLRSPRAGGNPDARHPNICLINASIFPSG